MTNLTEQWKKGELKTGDYYVKVKNGQVFVYHINHSVKHIYHNHVGEIKEVLAEVPDYLIWKNYVNGYCDEHEYNLQLIEENQKLKELLKECRDDVYNYQYICLSTLTKIDEVLK